jgi:hypothetical protein
MDDPACDCSQRAGRVGNPVDEKLRQAVLQQLKESIICDRSGLPACSSFCLCEIEQLVEQGSGSCYGAS